MPYGPLPTSVPPWAQPGVAAPRGSSRLAAAVAVLAVVSLLALGVAAAAWFRAAPKSAAQTFSEQEQTTALQAVCTAQGAVKQALTAATHQPEAKESGNQLLIAINIRLAEYAGADYLSQQIAQNPAAPKAVTDPANGLVAALRGLAMGQLGDAPAESLKSFTDQIGSLTDEVTKACAGHT